MAEPFIALFSAWSWIQSLPAALLAIIAILAIHHGRACRRRLREQDRDRQEQARQRAERQQEGHLLTQLMEHAADLVVLFSPTGTVTAINQNGAALLGATPETVIGENWLERYVAPADRNAAITIATAILNDEPVPGTAQYTISSEGGGDRLLAWRHTAIYQPGDTPIQMVGTQVVRSSGNPDPIGVEISGRESYDHKQLVQGADFRSPVVVGVLATGHDITEQVRWEKALRQAQKMDAIGNLASGISHDVNNMLTPILSLTEMVLRDLPTDDRNHRRLRRVLEAANRAKTLVAQVNAYSRRDDNDVTLERIRLADNLQSTLHLARATVPASLQVLMDPIPPDLCLEADPAQLGAVVLNLISNTVDALEGRTGEIHLRAERIELRDDGGVVPTGLLPGPHIMLSVEDNGCGIPKDVLDRVFDPFFTTKDVGEGLGMGLAMVNRIVAAHNGAIEVASWEGQGTRLDLFFPATSCKEPDY